MTVEYYLRKTVEIKPMSQMRKVWSGKVGKSTGLLSLHPMSISNTSKPKERLRAYFLLVGISLRSAWPNYMRLAKFHREENMKTPPVSVLHNSPPIKRPIHWNSPSANTLMK